MKQTPQEKIIQKKMQPGVISLEGFLGNDNRNFQEIIAEDEKTLSLLGISSEDISEKLQKLTDLAFQDIDGLYQPAAGIIVEYTSVRGRVISPFPGQKPAPKGVINYYDKNRNIKLRWTPLNIKMIRDFSFFEGKGSPNRLEPVTLYRAFFEDCQPNI